MNCVPTTESQPGLQQGLLIGPNGGRTAHVSAVPRSNKMKVSGGTQTCTADLQTKIPPNTQHRSFSLTGTTAAQLSQSIRERLSSGSHSLPKPGSDLHAFQHRYTGLSLMIDLTAYMAIDQMADHHFFFHPTNRQCVQSNLGLFFLFQLEWPIVALLN